MEKKYLEMLVVAAVTRVHSVKSAENTLFTQYLDEMPFTTLTW